MQLKELASLQHKAKSLTDARHAKAQKLADQGLLLLAEAYRQGFREKRLLSQAHQQFLQALQQHRQNLTPYLGLAYLRALLGDQELAKKYLRAAMQIDAQHPEVQGLFLLLSGAKPPPPLQTSGPAANQIDLDHVAEQLESKLLQISSRLAKLKPQLGLSLDLEQVLDWRQTAVSLNHSLKETEHAFSELETELDVPGLRARQAACEQLCNQMIQTCRASSLAQSLNQEQEESLQAVSKASAQLNSGQLSEAECEQLIESLLDRCDQFADRLDAFENEGYTISTLLAGYKRFMAAIEALRNQLEEL